MIKTKKYEKNFIFLKYLKFKFTFDQNIIKLNQELKI